jgi:nicotinamidase/pyrazinamidase
MGATASKHVFLYKHKLKGEPWGERGSGGNTIALLLIDPQNDFVLPTGSLSVPGAQADCDRLARAISENKEKISDIFVTLDTHERYHIAHPIFWTNDRGEHPKPFSTITPEDVNGGVWRTTRPAHAAWAKDYVAKLKAGGRFQLTIWPEHCLIGSTGHAVYDPLHQAIHEWEACHQTGTTFVMKGNNAFTEHYSAIKAEVTMPEDPRTYLNTLLIQQLLKYDMVVIAGEALSHCVNFTVRDLVGNISRADLQKVVIVSDGCSPVRGFEAAANKFTTDMAKLGIRFASAAEVFG